MDSFLLQTYMQKNSILSFNTYYANVFGTLKYSDVLMSIFVKYSVLTQVFSKLQYSVLT